MKKLTHIISIIVVICWVTVTLASTASGLAYLTSQQSNDGIIGGLSETGWAVMALGAYNQHNAQALNVLKQQQQTLSQQATTDIERQILALVAAGQNPRTFGNANAIAALNTRLVSNQFGNVQFTNDDIFGLLALRAADDPLPGGVIQTLVAHQDANGGWGIVVGGGTSSDMTAAALLALRGTGVSADVITKAETYLQSLQNDDGGFATQTGASNLGSSAWVGWFASTYDVVWEKSGHSVFDYLASQQSTNGGWFDSVLLTSYSLIALSHKSFPVIGAVQPPPTPTPTPSPTPTATPTVTPSPTPSPSPTTTPSPTPSPSPTMTPTPSPTPSTTPTATPTATPSPSSAPTARPSATPTPIPAAVPVSTYRIASPAPKSALVRVSYGAPKQSVARTIAQAVSPTPLSTPETTPTIDGPSPTASVTATPAPTTQSDDASTKLWLTIGLGVFILGINIAVTAYDFTRAHNQS